MNCSILAADCIRAISKVSVAHAVALGIAVGPVAIAQSQAQQSWSVRGGVVHSDNLNRSSTAKQADTAPEAGIAWNYVRENGPLEIRLLGDLTYETYRQQTSDSKLRGGARAFLGFSALDEKLRWIVEDNFGQSRRNATQGNVRENLGSFNLFTTGPDVSFELGGRSRVTLMGRYSQASYGDSINSNDRLLGGVTLARQLSKSGSVSLSAQHERAKYSNAPTTQAYDISRAWVGWNGTGARTEMSVRLGYNALHDNGDSEGGFLADVELSRRVSSRSTLRATLGTQLTDSASIFNGSQGFFGPIDASIGDAPTLDAFRSDFGRLAWELEGSRQTMSIGTEVRRERHEDRPLLDQNVVGGYASIRRTLASRLRGGISASYERREYENGGFDNADRRVALTLQWVLRPTMTIDATVERFHGNTSELTASDEYDENVYRLILAYSPQASR